jgi:hypothetical protein
MVQNNFPYMKTAADIKLQAREVSLHTFRQYKIAYPEPASSQLYLHCRRNEITK